MPLVARQGLRRFLTFVGGFRVLQPTKTEAFRWKLSSSMLCRCYFDVISTRSDEIDVGSVGGQGLPLIQP
jgi:hypothetical protein